LRGNPELLLRLRGNDIEASGSLPLPSNLGSPGQANSRALANTGPAIYDVQHQPVLPAASQNVIVTARVHDPDGLSVTNLKYRIDPSTSYSSVALRDDGLGGDGVAGDGIYSAIIPGQATNTLVAFFIEARDNAATPLTSYFPILNPTPDLLT